MDMTREQEHALIEGEQSAASDEYFGARPQLDLLSNRRIFESGFKRGFDSAIAHLRQPAPTAPEGWELVPKLGTRVKAKHPITCLNPTEYFEVTGRRADPGTPSGFSVRGENTCWFGLSAIELPTPTAQGELRPLPEPRLLPQREDVYGYEEEDMQAYARTAIAHFRSQQLDVLKLAEVDLAEEFEAFGNDLSPNQSLTKVRAAIATAQAAAGVPEGWLIRRADANTMIVQKPDVGGYTARADDENIASFVLYELTADLLAAAPSAPAQSDSAGDVSEAAISAAMSEGNKHGVNSVVAARIVAAYVNASAAKGEQTI